MSMTRVHPVPAPRPRRVERDATPEAQMSARGGIPVYISVLAAIGVSLLLWAGIIGLALLIF